MHVEILVAITAKMVWFASVCSVLSLVHQIIGIMEIIRVDAQGNFNALGWNLTSLIAKESEILVIPLWVKSGSDLCRKWNGEAIPIFVKTGCRSLGNLLDSLDAGP